MPRNHEEIIAEIQDHMRKLGGSAGDWCVGTAKDSRGPFFASHRVSALQITATAVRARAKSRRVTSAGAA